MHILLVCLCFALGITAYWYKRAYYGINPPQPVATGYIDWLKRSSAPLIVRALVDIMLFWLFFIPGYVDKLLGYLGWSEYEWVIVPVIHVPPLAFFLGLSIDSLVDVGISKIPILRDWLPQMPGPLPQKAVVEAQLVEQTTRVTQLQTTTTEIPNEQSKDK